MENSNKWVRSQADEWAVESGCYFDEKAAERVAQFFRQFLCHSKGEFAGKPFELMDWQYNDIVAPLFGWKRPDGLRRYRRAYIEIPKKPLALDTPIPTADGWRTMENIIVGDTVFDENGSQCNVTNKYEIQYGKQCYKLTFSDGSSVVAASDHEWVTQSASNKKYWKLRDTEEIYQTQEYKGRNGHNVWMNGAIQCENNTKLSISPYLLGYYLGNGSTKSGVLSCNRDDTNEVCGLIGPVSFRIYPNGDGYCDCLVIDSIYSAVKLLGIGSDYTQKHIPNVYLRSAIGIRYALLRGLMDSDGCHSSKGQCIYATAETRLRDCVIELLRSLGFKTTVNYIDETARTDRNCKGYWKILFTAFADQPVFGLRRKQSSLPHRTERCKQYAKAIVAVEKVESVPVQCIEVDSPSHMYLVSDGFTPTHNSGKSTTCAGIALYLLVGDSEPGAEIYSAAGDRSQAKIVFNEAKTMVEASPALKRRIEITEYKSLLRHHKSNSIYTALSADVKTKEGLNIHGLIFDELHTQPNRKMFDTLKYGGISRRQPMMIVITTAGDDPYSLCYEEHLYAERVISSENGCRDDEYYGYIRCANEKDDIEDEETWRKANPSYGITMNAQEFRSTVNAVKNKPNDLATFKRYRLNIWCTSDNKWIDTFAWGLCAHNDTPFPPMSSRVYLGLDLSSSVDLCCLAQWFPDHRFVAVDCWCIRNTIDKRILEKRVRYDQWIENGWLRPVEAGIMDYGLVLDRAREIGKCWGVEGVGVDPWNATMVASELEKDGARVEYIRQNVSTLSAPMKELERLYTAGELTHHGNPLLAWAASNVVAKEDANNNLFPNKQRSRESIDPITAILNAMAVAIKDGDRPRESVYTGRGIRCV